MKKKSLKKKKKKEIRPSERISEVNHMLFATVASSHNKLQAPIALKNMGLGMCI